MNEPTVNTNLELNDILSDITFVNTVLDFKWTFEFKPMVLATASGGQPLAGSQREGWLVWVTFERPDTITGAISRGRGRDEIVWKGATVSAVVKTAWVLVELMVRHELMEGFRWKNARIFNPHNSVFDLAEVQTKHENDIAKKVEKR
jgi:hypothetical protein